VSRILVVDDNADLRDLLFVILTTEGYSVSLAANGREALDLIKDETFDLLITDLVMPEKDGLSTIIHLRRRNSAIKIIAISGGDRSFDGSAYLKIAKNIGADRVMIKPFDNIGILKAVKEVLEANTAAG
jgi:DNA-binding response OmpR family regulator